MTKNYGLVKANKVSSGLKLKYIFKKVLLINVILFKAVLSEMFILKLFSVVI